MSDDLARRADLSLIEWEPSGGVLLVRDADDLNEREAMHLTPDELRWLALIGAAQAYRLLPEPVRAEAEGLIDYERPASAEVAPATDTPEAQEAQAMLDEPLFQT